MLHVSVLAQSEEVNLPLVSNYKLFSVLVTNRFTAPFNNMRTLKFEALNRQMGFSLPSIKCSATPPSFRLLPSTVSLSELCQRFDYRTLDSSRKLGGVAEHLIDGSEKHICRLSFEFQSPHVNERRSNMLLMEIRTTIGVLVDTQTLKQLIVDKNFILMSICFSLAKWLLSGCLILGATTVLPAI